MQENPSAYLDEIQAWLLQQHNIEAHISTISRTLKRINWTSKVKRRVAAQRNQELRSAWIERLSDFKAQQLVFIDESSSDERTGRRRNGWAPKGCPIFVEEELKRSPRWSILPAYTIGGYIATVLFQGSINKERFEDFIIDYVLPRCTPFPGRNSVLIMDNCSIHRSEVIVQACASAGVLIRFLPPYSPDFNPIESSFHDLKAWIRRNWIYEKDYQSFDQFLQEAICQNGDSTRAIAHFGNCMIDIEGVEPIVV